MTTTDKADTAQHPDVSEISDLTEGLLSPGRSAAIRRHLDGCALCADVRSSLEEIRGLLGTLPGPPRMPAEIAGRIDAALAAEALLDATVPDPARTVSRETPDALPTPSSPSAQGAPPVQGTPPVQDSPIVPPAEDADVVSRETARPVPPARPADSRPPTARPASRPASGPGRGRTRHRGRIALLTSLAGTLVAGVCAYSLYALTQNGASDTHATTADTAASAPLSTFSGEPVEDRVRNLLATGPDLRAPKGERPESLTAEVPEEGGSAQRGGDPTALPGCVLAGTGRQDPVLASERGEYEGTSAYLLVLADPADGDRVRAYLVDASCTGDTPGELLRTASYPKP
ncbi:hypothetical protein [Streptomyces griseus]|uniref:hypothetical protein n=1 Tax=Streptomyces griseus TaxID=1911 RepID=UPI0004C9A871|nr:hypothetical protein [Streptomyces griseus]